MLRKIIIISVVVAVLGGSGFLWRNMQQDGTAITPQKIAATTVKTAKVGVMPMPHILQTVGTLQANQVANISSNIAGKITSINFTPGSYVKKGQILFHLDDRTYQASLHSAKAAYTLDKLNYNRYTSLAKLGAQSQQMLDQARSDFLQAQAALATDKTLLSETMIKAPFSGYISQKQVAVGDYVKEGQTLTQLVDRKTLLVNFNFPEKYLNQIHLGQSVDIVLAGMKHAKQKTFVGKLNYIAPQVNTSSHSIAVQAEIDNAKNTLTPGLFVMVKDNIRINDKALVVPQEAIVATINGPQVYRVEKNKAVLVNVKTGITIDNKVQIKKGLQAGDVVITEGKQLLHDGSAIVARTASPSEPVGIRGGQ